MNQEQDWLTQLREKNRKIKKIKSNQDPQKVITDLYQISKPGSKKIEWVCRRREK